MSLVGFSLCSCTTGSRLREDAATAVGSEARHVLSGRVLGPDGEPVAGALVAAVSLDTVELERGFEDLRRVKDVIGDARVVGVGESTHGTREFFQFRHRLFEYLATELGFTVYVIEATLPGALAVNDYVLHGKGDAVSALAETFMWVHDTQEVLEFIEWMRRYNADPKHPRKLKFHGVDAGHPSKMMRVVLDCLREVDPGSVARVEALLAPVSQDRMYWKTFQTLTDARKAQLREGLSELLRRFDAHGHVTFNDFPTRPMGAWFQTRLGTRAVEAVFFDEASTETSMVPREEYDALFFVDRMTRARPNPAR